MMPAEIAEGLPDLEEQVRQALAYAAAFANDEVQAPYRAMRVKEFAAKVWMASPNVLRAINTSHNPTQDTLNRLLRPFKLRLTLAPLEPSNWIHRSGPKRYQATMHMRAGSTPVIARSR